MSPILLFMIAVHMAPASTHIHMHGTVWYRVYCRYNTYNCEDEAKNLCHNSYGATSFDEVEPVLWQTLVWCNQPKNFKRD